MVWRQASGLRPSSAASSPKNLAWITIPVMFASCSKGWAILCNGPPRVWSKLTRRRKAGGCATLIPALKKSPDGRGGDCIRGRGFLPPNADLARDLGTLGQPAANSHPGRAAHAEDFWGGAVGQRALSLSTPGGLFSLVNLCGVPGGGGGPRVLSLRPPILSHSRQRLLSQEAGNV